MPSLFQIPDTASKPALTFLQSHPNESQLLQESQLVQESRDTLVTQAGDALHSAVQVSCEGTDLPSPPPPQPYSHTLLVELHQQLRVVLTRGKGGGYSSSAKREDRELGSKQAIQEWREKL